MHSFVLFFWFYKKKNLRIFAQKLWILNVFIQMFPFEVKMHRHETQNKWQVDILEMLGSHMILADDIYRRDIYTNIKT